MSNLIDPANASAFDKLPPHSIEAEKALLGSIMLCGDDRKLYYEAVEEHHVVDLVLPEIKGTGTDTEQFAAKAKVLKDVVEHHAEEEETEMFPRARKLMGREELERLGGELVRAREALSGGILDRLAGLVRL